MPAVEDAAPCDVSVVLPIYNERGHLRAEIDRIVAALEQSEYSFEIVVVDDGSDDGSQHDLPLIEGIRLIRHATNRGSGAARRTGTTAARGRIVVWTDVDMTYPNDEIPELVKSLDGYDHVVGAAHRGGHASPLPCPRQVVHPQVRQLSHRDGHQGSQLGVAGVPA
ncbi:MAG: glycosyltransferase family 2 protein [Ilumatobacteraceae bacterium]